MPTLTETVAEAAFPMFERVLDIGREAANRRDNFKLLCSGIYEIGPMFAHGGVCLEATQLPLNDVTLGAGFYIVGPDERTPPFFRVTVGWHRTWTSDRQAGFQLLEYCSDFRPASEDAGRRWVDRLLPSFERSFRKALDRQKPPSRIHYLWLRFSQNVPPPRIMIHPRGELRVYPDVRTFAGRYDLENFNPE